MENNFKTSFIPRRPTVQGGADVLKYKSPPSFLLIAGIAVFVLTLALFGGLFIYKNSLTVSNGIKDQQIKEEIKNFEPELTKQLTVLKSRIDSGKQLLNNHIAFSSVLNLLESITVKSIRFTDLSFFDTQDPVTREPKISLNLKGLSQSYASIAFQSDLFSKNENFKSAIFSDLNLNEKGFVVFSIKTDIVSSSVLYKKTLSESIVPETSNSTSSPSSNLNASSTEQTGT